MSFDQSKDELSYNEEPHRLQSESNISERDSNYGKDKANGILDKQDLSDV